MLRSNSKEVKSKIRKYILKNARLGLVEHIRYGHCNKKDIKEKPITTVEQIFYMEYKNQIKIFGYKQAFINWIFSLCSTFPVYPGFYYATRELLNSWSILDKNKLTEYQNEYIETKFSNLIFREYVYLLNQEQKKEKTK